jgi:hypothetical protein
VTNSAPTNQQAPASTASTSNSGSSREFYDHPRSTTPSNSSPKGDEQFVDEPRPTHSQPQISSAPIQNNTPTRTASDQPASVTTIQNVAGRNQAQPAEEGSGFPDIVRVTQSATRHKSRFRRHHPKLVGASRHCIGE